MSGHSLTLNGNTIVAHRDGLPVTWSTLMQCVARVHARLTDTPAPLINLCEDPFHFLATFLAVAHADRTNLLPHNRGATSLSELQARYPGCETLDDACARAWLERSPERPTTPSGAPLRLALGAGAPSAIVFTSGSTGVPTALAKPWSELRAASERLQSRLRDYDIPAVTLVATVPAQHMYGLETTLLLPLLGGHAMHCARPFYPADIAAALASVPEPRGLVTTPMHLKHLLDAALPLPSVRLILSATAPLSQALAQQAEARLGATVVELYGASETGAIATRPPAHADLWQPLRDVSVTSVGDETHVDAPYLPATITLGDRVDSGGARFRLLGRGADMIKIAGKRASLSDLTHKLLAVPGVTDALIVPPTEDQERPARLIALIVGSPDTDTLRIKTALSGSVDPVFVPRTVHKVAALPRDGTGKVSRAALRALLDQLEQG